LKNFIKRPSRRVILAGAATVALIVGGLVATQAYASGTAKPLAGHVYQECVNTTNLDVHVTLGSKCATGYVPFTPKGLAGATGKQGIQGIQGVPGAIGATGATGAPGTPGTSAVVVFTASTSVSDRDDSGTDNTNWATDAFIRSATLTRTGEVTASHCDGVVAHCFSYVLDLNDSGSFLTNVGAHAPNDSSATISGRVAGSMTGGGTIDFYASTTAADAGLVDATLTGDVPSTVGWGGEFFVSGTHLSHQHFVTGGWTYTAPNTCEQWVDSDLTSWGSLDPPNSNAAGDVKGINLCS
jgi:hypothetical protein